jgi:hypothetical protein
MDAFGTSMAAREAPYPGLAKAIGIQNSARTCNDIPINLISYVNSAGESSPFGNVKFELHPVPKTPS